MDDLLARLWPDLLGRISGPMSFRMILQPAVATLLAIRAGMHDARAGRPFFGWSVATDREHRVEFLKAGWKDVAKVYTLAFVLDVVYQVVVFRWVYPIQSLIVAFLLAFVPYLLVRGPVNRLMRLRRARAGEHVA